MDSLMGNRKRIYLLDIIRGILIIYVVCYHFMYDLNVFVHCGLNVCMSQPFLHILDWCACLNKHCSMGMTQRMIVELNLQIVPDYGQLQLSVFFIFPLC